MTNLWHGFADMGAVDGAEFVVDRGEGSYVWDESGRRYLDATASLWYANVGFGRAEIARAAAAQLEKLHAYHVFGDFATRPVLDLADRLAALAPVQGSKVFLTSGGSDSVDTAAKLARRYFHEIGQPERTVILTRTWAYHGMHATAPRSRGSGRTATRSASWWRTSRSSSGTRPTRWRRRSTGSAPTGSRRSSASRSSAPAAFASLRTAT